MRAFWDGENGEVCLVEKEVFNEVAKIKEVEKVVDVVTATTKETTKTKEI